MPIDLHCKTCDLRFSLGWYHYHDRSSGYCAETLIACTACGTQHSIEFREQREPTFNVEIVSVPADDRIFMLRRIREIRGCSAIQAKEILEQVPTRLADQLSSGAVGRLMYDVSATGIRLELTEVQMDRLLAARGPCVTDSTVDREETAVITPLRSNHEIDVSIQQCRSCSAVGTLSGDRERFANCPHCRGATLETVTQWIT